MMQKDYRAPFLGPLLGFDMINAQLAVSGKIIKLKKEVTMEHALANFGIEVPVKRMSEDREFRDLFPALTSELEDRGTKQHKIDGVRVMEEETEPARIHFEPGVIDYIRRCDTNEQALEIVDYLLKRGEISQKEAKAIKSKLKTDGLRSFGSKKERDHYLHHGLEPE